MILDATTFHGTSAEREAEPITSLAFIYSGLIPSLLYTLLKLAATPVNAFSYGRVPEPIGLKIA